MPLKLTTARNIGGLWAVQIVKMVASIAVSVFVIRHLGPQQYGVFGIAAAVVTPFTALVGLPQGSLIVRELAARGEAGASGVLSTAFALKLAGGLAQLVLSLIAVLAMGYSFDVQVVTLFTALAYLAAPFTVIGSALEFDNRFDRVAAVEFAIAIGSLALRAALVAADANLFWFAASALVDALVQIGMYLVLNPRRGQIFSRQAVAPGIAWTFVRDGWPLLLTGMAMAIYTRSDVIFISKFLGEQQTGYYTAAIRITEVLYYFPGVIASIAFPALAQQRRSDLGAYYALLTKSCGAAFWLGVLLAAGLTVAAPIAFPLLFGARFAPSVPVIQIMAWSIPVIGMSQAFGASLTMEYATRVPLYAALCAAGISVALNLLLIPRAGLVGAAVVTVLSPLASLFVTFLIYKDARLFAALARALSPVYLLELVRLVAVAVRRWR